MTDHADIVRDALSWIHAHPGLSMDYQRQAEAALDALVAERDESQMWSRYYETRTRAEAAEAERDRLREAITEAIQVIEWCGENDKTPTYTYDGALKSTARPDGSLPGAGKAFNTPREFARYWPQVLRAALGEDA